MKRVFKLIVLMGFAMLVLAVLGGTALWHEVFREIGHGNPGFSVSINGDDLDLRGMSSGIGDGFSWLGTVIGLFIAGIVVCIVVPLVLLFSVGLPVLILGAVVLALLAGVFSIGAVLTSPLVLFVLLMVWLMRSKPRRAARRNGPNIAA